MLTPLPPTEWSLDHAGHLLSRAGFGGTPEQMRSFHALGLDAAVGLLLSARDNRIDPPPWTRHPSSRQLEMRSMMMGVPGLDARADLKRAAKRTAALEERQRLSDLREWWLRRMRSSGQPLVEKMTLFWHGHFATSIKKVKSAWMMWRQNETFRRNALGDFRSMLQAVARDPAMIRWLDLGDSRAGAPNENFSRELMELFTLGVGHYSEEDVKESARAFTGHRIDPRTMTFAIARRQHDYGEKHFLGRRGSFDGDGVIDVIVQQPACARFVGGRIWEFFAYENPEPAVLDAVAASFHRSGQRVAPLLGEIFRSAAFYGPRAIRTHIKSPVEWLVQSCVALETPVPAGRPVENTLEQLGQSLFDPPNVRGWEGGKAWISSSTLVLRYNFASSLVGATAPNHRRPDRRLPSTVDIARLAPADLRGTPGPFADALAFRLFAATQPPRLRAAARAAVAEAAAPVSDAGARSIFQRLMSTPDYQLS